MTKKPKTGGSAPSRNQIACRAAELAISKGGRPFVATVQEWLERRGALKESGGVSPHSYSAMRRDCAVIEELSSTRGITSAKMGESAAGLKFSLEQRDLQSSPLYPRAFSLAQVKGVSCAQETLAVNFPDPVSTQLRSDLNLDLDYRGIFGQGLGDLVGNVRQLFVWHYWGGTLSVMWGAPQNESSPMAPVGDWFVDQVGAKIPASAGLKTPVTSELTPCPECIGCAARYSGCFDLYVFIHGVRRLSRCPEAGGPVTALEVSFLDGARARQAVAESRLSSEDLANLITYCDALPGLEARASGIRMDLQTETARTCCVNAHFKDTASNTAALTGVLHAMSTHLVPSRVQAAVVAGAPFSELHLFRASLIPFDLDILSWAVQDVRDGPAFALPTSTLVAAAAASVTGRRSLVFQGGAAAAKGLADLPVPTPFLAPHLSMCVRACVEALACARILERLRRKELTFRTCGIYEGVVEECGHRMRVPDMWPSSRPPTRDTLAYLKSHLPILMSSKGRESQVSGEALWAFPGIGFTFGAGHGSGGERGPCASESGLNLAAISIFASASSLLCGNTAATALDSPNVLFWIPKKEGSDGGVSNTTTSPHKSGTVLYSRAATTLPKHPRLPWVTGVFSWFKTIALAHDFCDPVRRKVCPEDTALLLHFLAPEDKANVFSLGGVWGDWGHRDNKAHNVEDGLGILLLKDKDGVALLDSRPGCSNCGARRGCLEGESGGALMVCCGCSKAAFCSRACQKILWVAGHSKECGGLD